jgi:hypothetical protein
MRAPASASVTWYRPIFPLQSAVPPPLKEARKVEIFDTSLRDGLQQPNIDISVPNAVNLLRQMAAFGVHYAEIGFAGANQFVTDLTAASVSMASLIQQTRSWKESKLRVSPISVLLHLGINLIGPG